MRRLAQSGILAAALTSCALLEPEAAHQLDLANTAWHLATVDGVQIATPLELRFLDLHDVVLDGPCGQSTAFLARDTDGSAIGFGEFSEASGPCATDERADHERVLDALQPAEEWRVLSQERIEIINLVDDEVMALQRVGD